MPYEPKPLPFESLVGISDKTTSIHHDKLYAGYVAKMNEVGEKLRTSRENKEVIEKANATFSELRALRDAETFARNAVYLHEGYFESLGGDGVPSGELIEAIKEKWGSLETFINFFSASGMAMRGWVVLAYDFHTKKLMIYGADAHNQGGVWGAVPIIVLDVYEHAYFMDYGADRKTYIADFWKNLNWKAVNQKYLEIIE
ncbi:MAG: superoxide dismutase [bacterium]